MGVGHRLKGHRIVAPTAISSEETFMTSEDAQAEPAVPATPLVEIFIGEDLTANATTRLNAMLNDALDLRPAHLIVDLAGCAYADALAVDVLLNAHRRAWHLGGRLTLRAPSPRVQRLLELTHVDQVFNITLVPPLPPAPPKVVASVPPVVR
jgi:anti-anti-sigma factor